MNNSKLKGIDLFCGIGGGRLAMEENDVKCVFSSDNDKFVQETYQANFGEVPSGDIKDIKAKDIPSFDVLTAGFPCQPFSYAGEKKGFSDKVRGTLFFDICRILEYHRPPMVFLENVKGIVSHDHGRTLNIIHKTMGNLGYGVLPTHPGEVLKDEIEERGISQRQLAKQMGLAYSVVNEMLNARRPLTAKTALMFEAALDIPAESLMYLQTKYNIQTARNDSSLSKMLKEIRKVAAVF